MPNRVEYTIAVIPAQRAIQELGTNFALILCREHHTPLVIPAQAGIQCARSWRYEHKKCFQKTQTRRCFHVILGN